MGWNGGIIQIKKKRWNHLKIVEGVEMVESIKVRKKYEIIWMASEWYDQSKY